MVTIVVNITMETKWLPVKCQQHFRAVSSHLKAEAAATGVWEAYKKLQLQLESHRLLQERTGHAVLAGKKQ